ncbi:hypothetical protein IWQ49_004019 [Labrenzia sp. EL_126]|nr:hypothetical protein [Labrenzia sp. EL_126]
MGRLEGWATQHRACRPSFETELSRFLRMRLRDWFHSTLANLNQLKHSKNR